jgi:DNA-damage-inducible protein J
MGQTVLFNFRMDAQVKADMEKVCEDLGMNMSTAFNIYAKKIAREHRIPFELNADPFYSESNLAFLREGIEALNAGKGTEHELIEVDE